VPKYRTRELGRALPQAAGHSGLGSPPGPGRSRRVSGRECPTSCQTVGTLSVATTSGTPGPSHARCWRCSHSRWGVRCRRRYWPSSYGTGAPRAPTSPDPRDLCVRPASSCGLRRRLRDDADALVTSSGGYLLDELTCSSTTATLRGRTGRSRGSPSARRRRTSAPPTAPTPRATTGSQPRWPEQQQGPLLA
jgi:hypothetical protein